jgi:hypothetical protein
VAGIANHYASAAGVEGTVGVGNESSPGGFAYTKEGNAVFVNETPKRTDWYDDYNNLTNGLNHEGTHQARDEGGKVVSGYDHVAGAFLGQMQHSSFAGTTQQFKTDVFALTAQTLNSASAAGVSNLAPLVESANKAGASYNLSIVNSGGTYYVQSIKK